MFRHEAKIIRERLTMLGNKIVENIDDEKIEKIFLDIDFKDRTLLKIVTRKNLGPIFASMKLNVLLNEIWEGKNTYECDGQMADYSILKYLASSRIKKLPGKKISVKELILQNFVVNIKEQKYWFQYKFRHYSIAYIYNKDFFSSICMVVLF